MEQHTAGLCDTKIADLCHKVKHLQTVISEQKKTIADLSSAQKTFRAAVSPLQIEIDGYAATIGNLKAEKRRLGQSFQTIL